MIVIKFSANFLVTLEENMLGTPLTFGLTKEGAEIKYLTHSCPKIYLPSFSRTKRSHGIFCKCYPRSPPSGRLGLD